MRLLAFLALAGATALAQGSPSYFDRHCAQQPTDPQARAALARRMAAQLESGSADERSLAADTLSCLGESSRGAVPGMIRLFADPAGEIQANAVAAVAHLGEIAVPALVTALDSPDLSTRNNAARALARIGPAAQAALPRLRQLAADADPAYSPSAERAIRRIGAPPSGTRLTITETAYSRALPHAFFDQAMSSLPQLHPRHQLLAGRRTGALGEVLYALVCYKEAPSSEHAVIAAVAVFRDRAWNLSAIAPLPYGDALVEVLEQIAKLPSTPRAGAADAKRASP